MARMGLRANHRLTTPLAVAAIKAMQAVGSATSGDLMTEAVAAIDADCNRLLPQPRTAVMRWLLAGSWTLVLTFALLKTGNLLVRGQHAAWIYYLNDPDNYMRLAQIRDWLGGQSWWDVTQYRVDPPHGLHTHWSRLADLPVGLATMALTPFAGGALAERLAVMLMPPVLLIAAMVLMVAIADGLAGRMARFPAAFLTLCSAKFDWEFVPGRIDHHGLQIVLLLCTLAALVAGERRRHGLVAALAVALALGTGMETAPYLVAVALWAALRWALRGKAVARVTVSFFGGIAMLVPAVFAATVPAADWLLAKSDAIGRGHVVAAVVLGGTLALAAARAPARWSWPSRLMLVACIGGIGAASILAVFPEVIDKPYAMVGPLLQRLWIGNIEETRTVVQDWKGSPLTAAARMAFNMAMPLAGIWLASRAAGVARDRFALLSIVATVALVLTGWQFRAIAPAATVALPLAAALVVQLTRRSLMAAGVAFVASAALLLVDGFVPKSRPQVVVADAQCAKSIDYTDIAKLTPGLVLTQIDLSGTFLVWTPHSVISSGIHRGFAGNRFAFETWMADPAMARQRLTARGVRYVADCTIDPETRSLAREAPHGLAAALARGDHFAWLQPVAHSGNPAFKFYRVLPGAQ